MPKDRGYSPWCTEECHLDTTGWRSPPDPTDNRMDDKGLVEVPAQALGLMSGLGKHERPPVRQETCLKINLTKRVQAG